MEKSWKNHRNIMAKSQKDHRKIMQKLRIIKGKISKNYGKFKE